SPSGSTPRGPGVPVPPPGRETWPRRFAIGDRMRTAPALILQVVLVSLPVHSAGAALLPSDFTEANLGGPLPSPTAMTLAPAGRVFVCERGGALRVIKDGALLATPFLTVPVDSSGERGLLGVALDPDFAANGFVYVYHTTTTPTTHNQVSRFTANGDVAVPGSEVKILDLDPLSGATNHNREAIHFRPDRQVYIPRG